MQLAHAFLVYTHFLKPKSVTTFHIDQRAGDALEAVFREPIRDAILRLKAEGYLVPAYTEPFSSELFEKLGPWLYLFLPAQMKRPPEMPSDGIKRLLQEQPEGMARHLQSLDICIASESGRRLAQSYVERHHVAEASALEAFLKGDIAKALDAAEKLSNDLGVPQGALYQRPRPALWLETLAKAAPKILTPLPSPIMEQLRQELAVEAILSGLSYQTPKEWAAAELEFAPFKKQHAKKMLESFATNRHMLLCYLRGTFRHVTVFHGGMIIYGGLSSPPSCKACLAIQGSVWPIEEAPELPHPGCTHPDGCRCRFSPVKRPPSLIEMEPPYDLIH